MMRRLLLTVIAACAIASAHGQFGDDGDGLELEERVRLTEEDAHRDLQTAIQTTDRAERGRLILALLDSLRANPEVILPPRDWQEFSRVLVASADPVELRKRVPALLADRTGADIDPTIVRRVNLGLEIASVVGGAEATTLRDILRELPDADRVWLLPALGKVGGKSALSDIAPFRADETIKPLSHPQNLQPVPCAAVLGAAYAGDQDARVQVLQWYEDDSRDLSRFAWYVEWARREGTTPDYRMLDYCQQRLAQGKHYLDSIPDDEIGALVTRAVDLAMPALTDYLLARLRSVPASGIAHYVGLLRSPLLDVKLAAASRIHADGDAPLNARMIATLESQISSPSAIERYAAMSTLMQISPTTHRARITAQIANDPSPELRRRMTDDLTRRSTVR